MLRNPVSKGSVLSISLGLLALGALPATPLALMPRAPQAYGGVPIKGTFTAAASVTPNAGGVSYCGGPAYAYDLAVEAYGAGYSTLGASSLFLQKTIQSAGPLMHGCLTLTAPNGDTLNATYDGTEGGPDANNFIVEGKGTRTFTGGTGRFRDATGIANFTAVFHLGSPVLAFYSVEGSVSLHDDDR